LILLVSFLLQNARPVKISFLGANGHMSLAVALLIASEGHVGRAATARSTARQLA
jgi:uncharacterized integral membrane protein